LFFQDLCRLLARSFVLKDERRIGAPGKGAPMRKIICGVFTSLDGVIQAPGGPDEDTSSGFELGGWVGPYWDETADQAMMQTFAEPFDLLLGRRTYDIFAAYWPNYKPGPDTKPEDVELNLQVARTFDAATKYVATHDPASLKWQNSQALGPDIAAALRDIKKGEGPQLIIQGSSNLIHQLAAADLIDEYRLLTFPILLGKGKRLFDDTSRPGQLKVMSSVTSKTGVVIATYQRDGEVQTAAMG